MLHVQTQYKKQKAALVVVLLVLFLFQAVVAATKSCALDLQTSEITNQDCMHNCTDHHDEISGINNSLPDEDGKAHCDDCEHCLGCHLAVMVHDLATHPISESCSRFTYLIRLTKPCPTNIDRPPIA